MGWRIRRIIVIMGKRILPRAGSPFFRGAPGAVAPIRPLPPSCSRVFSCAPVRIRGADCFSQHCEVTPTGWTPFMRQVWPPAQFPGVTPLWGILMPCTKPKFRRHEFCGWVYGFPGFGISRVAGQIIYILRTSGQIRISPGRRTAYYKPRKPINPSLSVTRVCP